MVFLLPLGLPTRLGLLLLLLALVLGLGLVLVLVLGTAPLLLGSLSRAPAGTTGTAIARTLRPASR